MCGAINNKILLYADDAAIYIYICILISDKHVDSTDSRLGTALETISVWLIDNKLLLHLGKTESILFGTKRKFSKRRNLEVSYYKINIDSKLKHSLELP